MALTADQLNTIYNNVLFRNVDAGGIQFFANRTDISDAQVRQQIELSPEATTYVSPIVRLYQAEFGRVPDVGGLKFFVQQYEQGGGTQNISVIAQQLLNSAEATSGGTTAGNTLNATFVSTIYNNILGRTASTGEVNFWTGSGKTAAVVLSEITNSNESAQRNAAGTVTFLDSAAVGTPNGGSLGAQTGAGGSNAGTTFNLVTGADSIAGTGGNDTINGLVDTATATNSTLTAADTINGGAGTADILNVTINGAGSAINGALISNVEGLQVRNIGVLANVATVDASTAPGLTFINANLGTGSLTVTNAAAGTAFGDVGNGTVVNGNLVGGYGAAATNALLTVANGTTAGNVTLTGTGTLTSAAITSLGATNTLGTLTLDNTVTAATINAATNLTLAAIADTGLKTLTISGAAPTVTSAAGVVSSGVTVGTLGAAVTTVDASGLTAGGVTATLDAALTSFKGGQGNDVITAVALTSTTAGIVNAGAGTGDRLIASNVIIDTATKGAQFTNFEVLQNNATGQFDASFVSGITSVETSAGGAGFRNLSASQAAAVTVLVDNASPTFALTNATGTSDVLTVTLKNATATASADLTGATVTGFETLNVVSSSGNTADINALSFAAAGDLTALNLSGAAPITVTTTNLTKAVTIDASALSFVPGTGAFDLTIAGNLVKGSIVNGSANADGITTTAAIAGTTGDFVIYNAGAGNDTITTTIAALNNVSAATGSVKIDGGAGTDTLNTDASTAYVDANFQFVTGIEKIAFGAGALTFTSGGFFDNNFKSAGVAITDTFGTLAAGGGSASTIDLTSFTGNVTDTLTEIAGGNVADVIIARTGTGNDTVTVTTNAALTSITNEVSVGAGTDVVTINAAALATTGKFTVNLGAGNDTINANYATTGLLTVTGGTGADLLAFSTTHTNVFNAIQGIGDSGTFARPTTNTISTANFDVITGSVANDTITLGGNGAGNTFVTVVNTGADLSTATFSDQTATVIKGIYDNNARTFVGSATGADALVVYDSTAGATTTLEAVVVTGHVAVTASNLGVLTIV